MDSETISIILLAAGASERMGSTIKQLLPWGNNTLIGHAIEQTRILNAKTYVVLGAHAEEIKSKLSDDVEVLLHSQWKNGMGSSIAFGVEQVLQINPKTKTIMILLADQPFLDTRFLENLLNEHQKRSAAISATKYPNERVGVPAIFNSNYFSALRSLKQDKGARELLNNPKENILTIKAGKKAFDIDTIEDYHRLLQTLKEGKAL
ncbi:MAG: nucleotidyltransferase family protein [Bacteroidota bacterium]